MCIYVYKCFCILICFGILFALEPGLNPELYCNVCIVYNRENIVFLDCMYFSNVKPSFLCM